LTIDVFLDHDPSVREGTTRETEVRSHTNRVDAKLSDDLISLGTDAVQVINVFVVHKEYDALRLEHTDAKLIDFGYHWDQECVQ
jgi:hypothetical protein